MHLVFASAARAFKGLFAPGMGWIFFGCFLATALTLVLVSGGLVWGIDLLVISPENRGSHHAMFGAIAVLFFSVIALTLLFPLLMPIIVSFFDEQIAERIERDDYPMLRIGTSPPFWEDVRADLRFTAKAIGLNLLALPLSIVFFPTYYLLNAYLLGTQFFMMAGGRHIGKQAARALADRNRSTVMFGGFLITLCAQVPLLNLITPFWGVALMVHLFQRLNKEQAQVEITVVK